MSFLAGLISGTISGATYLRWLLYVDCGEDSPYETGWLLGFSLGFICLVVSIPVAIWALITNN